VIERPPTFSFIFVVSDPTIAALGIGSGPFCLRASAASDFERILVVVAREASDY
jgi:hypothetical protein